MLVTYLTVGCAKNTTILENAMILKQEKIQYLRFRSKQAFADYCVQSRNLPPASTEFSLILTRGEFERFFMFLAGIDDRTQSIAFKTSIVTVERTLKICKRKYYYSEFNKMFFNSPLACEAQQKDDSVIPLIVDIPKASKVTKNLPALELKPIKPRRIH